MMTRLQVTPDALCASLTLSPGTEGREAFMVGIPSRDCVLVAVPGHGAFLLPNGGDLTVLDMLSGGFDLETARAVARQLSGPIEGMECAPFGAIETKPNQTTPT